MSLLLLIIVIVVWPMTLIFTKDNDTIGFSSDTEDNNDSKARFLPFYRLARSTNNDTIDKRSSQAIEAVVHIINEFSVKYFKILLKSGRQTERVDNMGCTPISTFFMLSMAAYGAGGQTAKQLRRVLALPRDDNLAKLGFQVLIQQLQLDRNVDLVLRSNIFVAKGISLGQDFIDMALQIFQSHVKSLNSSEPAEVVATIEKSYGPYIHRSKKKHIRQTNINGKTRLISANIIQFASRWPPQFQPCHTKYMTFHVRPKHKAIIAAMYTRQLLKYGRFPWLHLKFVGIPLTSQSPEKATMIYILLPDEIDDLERVEKNIMPFHVNKLIDGGNLVAVELHMPIIKIDTNATIDGLLKELGFKNMFHKSATFWPIMQKKRLSVTGPVFTEIVQPVFIEINKNDVRFKSRTDGNVTVEREWDTDGLQNIEFTVNRPFLWMIISNSRRVPLFMGRFVNPLSNFF